LIMELAWPSGSLRIAFSSSAMRHIGQSLGADHDPRTDERGAQMTVSQ
jgi:hypothetical protein